LAPGAVVAGKYQIESVLGRGGMGTVFRARHRHLGTSVALKFLHERLISDPNTVERFLREARASAALKGENVCRVSDVGSEGNAPYMVMELLEGIDLAYVLEEEGALTATRARDYILQACAGLAEAHANGIIHRDLKPSNLFLTKRPDGTPLIKVLDFGVAKAPDSVQRNLTESSFTIGSPTYMSPEQLVSSKDVDARGDIWALGVILFELIQGTPPFSANTVVDLGISIANDPTPPLPDHRGGLEDIIHRCLQKDREQRYASARDLADALA
jgi:serine/threonine-protein kinase